MASEELNHVDPADLSDLLAGLTSDAKEREIRQHLRVCGLCQAELALAKCFHEQSAEEPLAPQIKARLEAGLATARPRTLGWRIISRRQSLVGAGLLAASIVCALLGINALREPFLRQGPSGALRATHSPAAWDLHLDKPESGSVKVAWPTVDGALEYEIRLQSTTGETLWSRREVASPYELTALRLPTAVRTEPFLFVSVVALMADGTQQTTPPHPLPPWPLTVSDFSGMGSVG